jgi:uncharacterized protein YkwD
MVKGIGIAFAILVFSYLPGVAGTAEAKTTSITKKEIGQKNCKIPQYSLVSSLKSARFTTNSKESDLFVPAVFTSAKESNGSLSAAIGVSVADSEESQQVAAEPVITAQPQPTVSVSPEPSATVADAAPGLDPETIFAMVNAHRTQRGLPPFQKSGDLTQIAESRTPELQGEMYGGGGMHAGFYNRHLPYWATENMISQNTETDAVNWWLNSSVHRSAIEGNYTHASVACEGKNCAMIFSSFAPKQ